MNLEEKKNAIIQNIQRLITKVIETEVTESLRRGEELMRNSAENDNAIPYLNYFYRIFGKNINLIVAHSNNLRQLADSQAIIEIIIEAKNNRFAFDYLLYIEEKYPSLTPELTNFVRDVAHGRIVKKARKRGRDPYHLIMRNFVICEAVKLAISHGLPAYSTDNIKSVTACSVVDKCLQREFNIYANVIQIWKGRAFD